MNSNIIREVDEIIDYIKKSDTYKDYKYLEDKLSKHDKCNKLINEVKEYQRILVKKQLHEEDITDIEYIDSMTLEMAFEDRKEIE